MENNPGNPVHYYEYLEKECVRDPLEEQRELEERFMPVIWDEEPKEPEKEKDASDRPKT